MEGIDARVALGVDADEPWIGAVRRRVASPILRPLLAGIGVVLVLHFAEDFGLYTPPDSLRFSLGVDRGLGELFGYVVIASILSGLLSLWRADRGQRVFVALAGLFAFVLADDMLKLHETVGRRLGDRLDLPTVLGLAPMEIGQLVYFAAVGVVALVGGWFAWRAATGSARIVVAWLGAGMTLLALFAVVVDAIHESLRLTTSEIDPIWAAVEDGGELVSLALIASYLFARVEEAEATATVGHDEAVIDLRDRVPAIREALDEVPVER